MSPEIETAKKAFVPMVFRRAGYRVIVPCAQRGTAVIVVCFCADVESGRQRDLVGLEQQKVPLEWRESIRKRNLLSERGTRQ